MAKTTITSIFLVVAIILIAIFYFMDYSFLDSDNDNSPLPAPTTIPRENFSTYYDEHQGNYKMVPLYVIILLAIMLVISSMQ